MPNYVVRPEPEFYLRREASFDTLSSARYFARTWAYKSRVPIVVVDGASGEPWRGTRRSVQAVATRISALSHSMMAAWSRLAASICAAGAPGGRAHLDIRAAHRLGAARTNAEPRAVVEDDLDSVEVDHARDASRAASERQDVADRDAAEPRGERRVSASPCLLPDTLRRSKRYVPSSASVSARIASGVLS